MVGIEVVPTNIVSPDQLLSDKQILGEMMNYVDLAFAFGNTPLESVQWLAKRRLLHNSFMCGPCRIAMSFVQKPDTIDGYCWQCRLCRSSTSLRKDSFFSDSVVTFSHLIRTIYGWCNNYLEHQIAREADIPAQSIPTVVEWTVLCREICEQYLENNPCVIGGVSEDGLSKYVEIDQTRFFYWKHRRNQWRKGHWIVGGIEKGSGRCFLVEVPGRSEGALMKVIRQYILPGTIIISDKSKAFGDLSQVDGGIYEHLKSNQETFWSRAKQRLRRREIPEDVFESYLHAYLWRISSASKDIFAHFLLCIAEQYLV